MLDKATQKALERVTEALADNRTRSIHLYKSTDKKKKVSWYISVDHTETVTE